MPVMNEPGLPVMPATAVFGADGYIGRNLLRVLRQANPDSVGVGRRSGTGHLFLDLARPDTGPLKLKSRGITHAVIAAGITKVALCEREPERSRTVNVLGSVELARQLRQDGVRVIALSSDYVFDGRTGGYDEHAPVKPLNGYGRQKAEMEEALFRICSGDVLVVRLSKVFDTIRGSGTLLDEMAGKLLGGGIVRAAFDQFFCPTLIDDVVSGVLHLLASERTGVVHLCSPVRVSRLQLAGRLAASLGCDPGLVQRISLRELDEDFARPLDTSMLCTRIAGMPPERFTSVDDCIARMNSNYREDHNGMGATG